MDVFPYQNGHLFYWHIFESLQQKNNKVDNFESLYCTMALICIEMGGDEVLMELFRLALGIQVGYSLDTFHVDTCIQSIYG